MPIIKKPLTLEELPPPPPGKTGWPWTEQPETLSEGCSNSSEWPLISIVTPSYNYGQFIEETIRSVLLQGYPNLEYIIIDGGSTDNTIEIIKKYEKFLAYWVSEPDQGQTDAINKGYFHCTGDIFAWINADDSYINSTCFRNIGNFYLEGYKFIAGSCLNVYQDGSEQIIYSYPTDFKRYLKIWFYCSLPQASVFVAKEITDRCFPLDKELYFLMDYQLFLRSLSQNPKSIYVNQTWTKIKYHGGNKTFNTYLDGLAELYKVALLEAKKLPRISYELFLIDVKDFKILCPLIYNESSPSPAQVLVSLFSRPTLIRWPLFWKLLMRTFIGEKRYLALKKLTARS